MKRALVCDHNQDVLYMVTFVLTGIGWEVITSTDCDDIITKTREANPSVILVDNDFPKGGGVPTIQTLKKHLDFKHIPVILLSSDIDITGQAREAGTNYCLSKPFEVKKLEKVISEAYKEFKLPDQS